ncbi:uncharacterized protein EMH_0073070 [Eimeria mitis]|uniref:Uncharacterized protein n=1 Tax=Eimeria mitis TaxID=44415 RepID=U6K9L9_9EIME|nr:uncharacterized protein EMH_0073070 [Eimeria mitis]CDJ32173.1 hypothetical protein EMH_0073070 [Eimeria mitis]
MQGQSTPSPLPSGASAAPVAVQAAVVAAAGGGPQGAPRIHLGAPEYPGDLEDLGGPQGDSRERLLQRQPLHTGPPRGWAQRTQKKGYPSTLRKTDLMKHLRE